MSDTSEGRRTKDKPMVTVIMAAYNCEDYVGEAIESVIAQTCPHWELICVDDASIDATGRIIEEYAEADDRIIVLTNPHNVGAAATRNRALKHARGKYIAILDADDIALPDRLERCLEVLEDGSGVDVVGSRAIHIDGSGREHGIWTRYGVMHSSVVGRADAFHDMGGYDTFFTYAHDSDLFRRMGPHYRFCVLEPPLVKYRWHGEQLTARGGFSRACFARLAQLRARALREGREIDLEREHKRLVSDAGFRSDYYYNAGWRHLSAGDVAQAREAFARACRASPSMIRPHLALALVWLPPALRGAARALWRWARALLPSRKQEEERADDICPFAEGSVDVRRQ